MLLVVLPILGLSLYEAFKQQAQLSEKQTLRAYSYNLLAAIEIDNASLVNDIQLDAPSFSIPDSGLYALIRDENNLLWHSSSFIPKQATAFWSQSKMGEEVFDTIVINNRQHFNWQMKVGVEQQDKLYPFTVHIIKSTQDYEEQLAVFTNTVWTWLASLGLVFVCLQILWMLWFNKPITDLSEEISSIEKGDKEKVSNDYPVEITALTTSLNRLIATEYQQRERYKNTLADLAHSVKNPLTIVMNSEEIPQSLMAELHKIDSSIEHQLKRAQGGQTSWQSGTKLLPIIVDLQSGLRKLYPDKEIKFSNQIEADITFFGAKADAYEILGNLLDNACKACHQRISLKAHQSNNLVIEILDDGPGISSDLVNHIMQRGVRADTYSQGQGIGLAVVNDLVSAYQGELTIDPESVLGGAKISICFPMQKKT